MDVCSCSAPGAQHSAGLGCKQEASGTGGFAFRTQGGPRSCLTHYHNKTYEKPTSATVALISRLFFFHRAIRLGYAQSPAATSRRTGGLEWTGTSRMRDPPMESHRLARRGSPLDCLQPCVKEGAHPAREQGSLPFKYGATCRGVPHSWKTLEPTRPFARAPLSAVGSEGHKNGAMQCRSYPGPIPACLKTGGMSAWVAVSCEFRART